MKLSDSIEQIPRRYSFNQFTRWFVLVLSILVIAYAIWVIIYKLDAESRPFFKIVPFVMIFLAINTILRNILTINKIVLNEKNIQFKYIGKKSKIVNYHDIEKISLTKAKLRAISIEYKMNSQNDQIMILLSYPKILEIINLLASRCTNSEYDEFVKGLILDRDKIIN